MMVVMVANIAEMQVIPEVEVVRIGVMQMTVVEKSERQNILEDTFTKIKQCQVEWLEDNKREGGQWKQISWWPWQKGVLGRKTAEGNVYWWTSISLDDLNVKREYPSGWSVSSISLYYSRWQSDSIENSGLSPKALFHADTSSNLM